MMKKFTLGIVDMQQKAYLNSNNDKETGGYGSYRICLSGKADCSIY